MLAQPRHPLLRAFGEPLDLDGVAGDEDRLGDAVGSLHGHDHVSFGEVGVIDDLGIGEAGPRGQPGGGERLRHLELGTGGRPCLDSGADVGLHAVSPGGTGGEALVVCPLVGSEHRAEGRPLGLTNDLDDDIAVAGSEGVHDPDGAETTVHAERREVDDDVGHGDEHVEHRHVDALRSAGRIALPQRRQQADHGEERARDVADGAHGGHDRWLPLRTSHLVDAAHGLDHGS